MQHLTQLIFFLEGTVYIDYIAPKFIYSVYGFILPKNLIQF